MKSLYIEKGTSNNETAAGSDHQTSCMRRLVSSVVVNSDLVVTWLKFWCHNLMSGGASVVTWLKFWFHNLMSGGASVVTWLKFWCHNLMSGRASLFDAFAMLFSNQMSQMLLLLPSCVAKLGWWRATLLTAVLGSLSCWTVHVVQVFFFRRYRTARQYEQRDENEVIVQWDKLLSINFHDHAELKKLGTLAIGFNCLSVFTRSIIQLNYAIRIIYFVDNKLDKRMWMCVLALCCILFALVPNLRSYRIFSILSLMMAIVAAVSIAVASPLHQLVQGVEHSVASSSSSIESLAWVSGTIVYAIGDSSVYVGTLVTTEEWRNQHRFKFVSWGSTAFAVVSSLIVALCSYRVFGDALSEIPLDAQPGAVVPLPPSNLRGVALISLLILELLVIAHSLHLLFLYLSRAVHWLTNGAGNFHSLHRVLAVVGLVCIASGSIPLSGSMEITTSLVGSLIVGPAMFIIPAAAHMLYFKYRQHREDAGLDGFAIFTSYAINTIQLVGVLVFVTIMGGVPTSIKVLMHSQNFPHFDFWNRCRSCAKFSRSSFSHPVVPLVVLSVFLVSRTEIVLVYKIISVAIFLIVAFFVINSGAIAA